VALTVGLGRVIFGVTTGALAGLILATAIGSTVYSRVVSTDLLFTSFLSLALWAFWQRFRRHGWGWSVLLFVSIGLALMTKGAIGIVLPGLVIVAFLALSGEISALKRLGLWWGIPLALAIALPWHVLVALRHEDFWHFYVVDNQVLRFLGERAFVEDDVPLSLGAFALATATLFGPWSIFLPAALRTSADHLRQPTPEWQAHVFLLLWAGIIVLFFALSPLKLEHYGLPAFPALAILIAQYGRAGVQTGHQRSIWLIVPLIGLILPSLLLAIRAIPLDHAVETMFATDVYSRMGEVQGGSYARSLSQELSLLFQSGGAVLCIGAAATLVCALRRWQHLAFGCFALMAMLLQGVVGQIYQRTAEFRSVAPLAGQVLEHLQDDDLLVHEGPLENSAGLTFYTGKQVHVVEGQRGDLHFGSRLPEAAGLFFSADELTRLWQGGQRIFLVTDRPLDDSVLRLITPHTRHLIGHEGRRWLFTNRSE
jgi:4-amino-4-deoxy-L-arabinose transferase-like glycosyltransferase